MKNSKLLTMQLYYSWAFLISLVCLSCSNEQKVKDHALFVPANDTIIVRSAKGDYISPYIVRLQNDDLFISSRRSTNLYKYSILKDSLIFTYKFDDIGPNSVGFLYNYYIENDDLYIFENARQKALIYDLLSNSMTERSFSISPHTDCRITSLDAMKYSNIPKWNNELFLSVECDRNYKALEEIVKINRILGINIHTGEVQNYGLYPAIYAQIRVPINAIIRTSHSLVDGRLLINFPYSSAITVHDLMDGVITEYELSSALKSEFKSYNGGDDPREEFIFFEQNGHYLKLLYDDELSLFIRLYQYRLDSTEPIVLGDNIGRRYTAIVADKNFLKLGEFKLTELLGLDLDAHFKWNGIYYFKKQQENTEGEFSFVGFTINSYLFKK